MKNFLLVLAIILTALLCVAVFSRPAKAATVDGLGTDTLTVYFGDYAGYLLGFNADGTYVAGYGNTSPVELTEMPSATVVRFIETDPSNGGGMCAGNGYDSCISNAEGYPVGDPEGYSLSESIWIVGPAEEPEPPVIVVPPSSLVITCIPYATSTQCLIDNFDLLYFPFTMFLLLFVFVCVVAMFLLRLKKRESYGDD